MAMNSIGSILNHSTAIYHMVREQLNQERKHLENARCKPANWDGVSSYIEYATGVIVAPEDVAFEAHNFNFD